jgi:hypothetical protein
MYVSNKDPVKSNVVIHAIWQVKKPALFSIILTINNEPLHVAFRWDNSVFHYTRKEVIKRLEVHWVSESPGFPSRQPSAQHWFALWLISSGHPPTVPSCSYRQHKSFVLMVSRHGLLRSERTKNGKGEMCYNESESWTRFHMFIMHATSARGKFRRIVNSRMKLHFSQTASNDIAFGILNS